ncbi:MAG TPA: DUF3142 domain-containing protein [Terriglobia bacterium]|nr:DUF3142 domain-containing protein [Terriglobia bacterium]
MRSVLWTGLVLAPLLLALPSRHANECAASGCNPTLVLWAWERPEFLDFIDPRTVSVAYLDQTIYVSNRVTAVPRLDPLRVPLETRLIAVVRIEMPGGALPPSEETKEKVVAAIFRSAYQKQVSGLQIDFDAVQSQRPFYRDVLVKLRQQMPVAMSLSMTALASWCAGDDWIKDLPVDEAVPMLFQMGRDRKLFQSFSSLREPRCSGSLGLSLDEPWPRDHRGKRLYVFNNQKWTQNALVSVYARVMQ